MPDGYYNLLELKKVEAGIGYNLIEENAKLAPELEIIPADTITGTDMKLTVRTDLPTVAFRHLNQGVKRSKSGFDTKTFSTAILDHQVAVDQQLVKNRNPQAKGRVFENHASGAVEAAFRHVGTQFYYGVQNDPKGFVGLIAQHADDAAHTIDATGSANKTSIWFLNLGREKLEFLFGNDTTINFDPDWKEETVYDEDKNPYQAFTNWMTGAVGLRLANKNASVRVKNVGIANGTKATWDLMHQANQKMIDLKMAATHILMTGRTQEQLRQLSVTPENPNPPLPKEFEGIPIIRTASISNAETI